MKRMLFPILIVICLMAPIITFANERIQETKYFHGQDVSVPGQYNSFSTDQGVFKRGGAAIIYNFGSKTIILEQVRLVLNDSTDYCYLGWDGGCENPPVKIPMLQAVTIRAEGTLFDGYADFETLVEEPETVNLATRPHWIISWRCFGEDEKCLPPFIQGRMTTSLGGVGILSEDFVQGMVIREW